MYELEVGVEQFNGELAKVVRAWVHEQRGSNERPAAAALANISKLGQA